MRRDQPEHPQSDGATGPSEVIRRAAECGRGDALAFMQTIRSERPQLPFPHPRPIPSLPTGMRLDFQGWAWKSERTGAG